VWVFGLWPALIALGVFVFAVVFLFCGLPAIAEWSRKRRGW
jgi:hypothetical protein